MAAVVAVINYNGKVLVGKKKSDSGKFLSGQWHIPGGAINEGESDKEALVREMKEETSLDIIVGRYLGSSVTPTSGSEARWYECFSQAEDAVPGSDLEKLAWIDKDEVLYLLSLQVISKWPGEIIRYFTDSWDTSSH